MRGKRAAVLGGAGFLGSHLCETLLERGANVVCVDNFLTGSRLNLQTLLLRPAFQFIEADITEGLEIDGPVDYVLDFASPASPIDYAKLPIETLRVGSVGVENGLKLALAKKARFLLASTSEVYGDPTQHPQSEEYFGNVNPIGPRSCYDEAKRFAEAMTMAYHRAHGVDVRIVRIFNTYGPRMRLDDGRVVPAFIGQVLRGQPFTVFGEGKQTRSFCFVADEVRGILALLESEYRLPMNVGNPTELTILQFAEAVRQAARALAIPGAEAKIVHQPFPENDPKQRRPDISKAKALLGWEPRVSLEAGLRETLGWFKAQGVRT